ncbi:hypothetical protein TNCV_1218671 [Trichonephila clavipes]|nr:hypothetical protein TNCV_1218671 [Trichonephila clavipes]
MLHQYLTDQRAKTRKSYDGAAAHEGCTSAIYCAHPNIRDHWALRYKSRCPDQVLSLKRDPKCPSPQASLVLVYRLIPVGMKG